MPLPFPIEPLVLEEAGAFLEEPRAVGEEEEPGRGHPCRVLAEGLDHVAHPSFVLRDEEHSHVVHAEARLVHSGAEGFGVGEELPDD